MIIFRCCFLCAGDLPPKNVPGMSREEETIKSN